MIYLCIFQPGYGFTSVYSSQAMVYLCILHPGYGLPLYIAARLWFTSVYSSQAMVYLCIFKPDYSLPLCWNPSSCRGLCPAGDGPQSHPPPANDIGSSLPAYSHSLGVWYVPLHPALVIAGFDQSDIYMYCVCRGILVPAFKYIPLLVSIFQKKFHV